MTPGSPSSEDSPAQYQRSQCKYLSVISACESPWGVQRSLCSRGPREPVAKGHTMTSFLNGSFYNPARGGHAPGDVRAAFAAAIEAYDSWEAGEAEPTVELREQQVSISNICGLLWNCTDTMPNI